VQDQLILLDGDDQLFVRDADAGPGVGGEGRLGCEDLAQRLFPLLKAEGLLQVSDDVESEGRGHLLGGLEDGFAEAAHEDDTGGALLPAQYAQEFDSVHAGHDQIEQNQGSRE
jgi:hypothetical protein